MAILCRLGIHRWQETNFLWRRPLSESRREMTCQRCGKVKLMPPLITIDIEHREGPR